MRLAARLWVCFAILAGASGAAYAACDQTLGPGSNLASAVASAPDRSTICLTSGNYGAVDLFDIKRSAFVTIQSASGKGAVITPQIGNSTFIRLNNLTINGGYQNSCSRNIEWVANTVTDTVTVTNSDCKGSLVTLFNGNAFGAITVGGGYEGRLSLIYGSGITVTNNTFGPGGASDGIFMGGNVSNVTIGPGNTFTGILEANCGQVHCDAIQGYGAGSGIVVEGNLFEKGDTFIMMPDGSSGVTVKNNVFNGTGVDYPDKIQFGTANKPVFQHNTLVNVRASFDSKTGEPATSSALAENNVLVSGSSFKTANGNGCSGCMFKSNLFSMSGNASGSKNLIGTPSFLGGAAPSSYSGYQLTGSSIGVRAASDGLDMGVVYLGPAAPRLDAPKNLKVR